MSSFFLELSIVMLLTLVLSFFMTKLKQPLLIGYILTGVLSGPLFFNILSTNDGYVSFSHLGVALLLFIVGLHLNLKLIKEIGSVSLIVGLSQIFITTLFAFIISFFLSFNFIESMLISIGLSFSSTIVIVKLLTDKKDIEKVYGKLSMGILIVQDLVAVMVLMILNSISKLGSDVNIYFELIKTFMLGILALFLVLLFSKFILEKLLDKIAESQDLFFIFIISWVLGISALFFYLGFSVEIGALLAGVALASSAYQVEISSKVKPLRDFFIVMFFILLGSQMIPVSETLTHAAAFEKGVGFFDSVQILISNMVLSFNYMFENFSSILIPALFLSLFVLVVKPIIVFILFNLFGFHKKVSFMAGISLGQVSEFSLILLLLALDSNLISNKIVSLITLVAIITITISTYMITHSAVFYEKMKYFISFLEIRKNARRDAEKIIEKKQDILIFGYDRIGYSLLNSIEKLNKDYIIIDYNPSIIKRLEDKKINCIYGDASDIEFLAEFELNYLELVISTIPDFETNMIILNEMRKQNHGVSIILTADKIDNALELYKHGADYVILPHFLGGDYVGSLIESYHGNFNEILVEKVKHINELKQRKELGHDHPK